MAWYQLPHCWSKLFPNARSLWLLGIRRHLKVIKRLHRKTDKEINPLGVVLLVAQLCPMLCDPRDCSPPGSSVQGVLQARILEWLPFPSPGDLPRPGIKCTSPALTGRFFTTEPPGKPQIYAAAAAAVLLQSCPTLCDPIDGSPPGCTIYRVNN